MEYQTANLIVSYLHGKNNNQNNFMTFPGFYKERQIPPDFQGMEREKS